MISIVTGEKSKKTTRENGITLIALVVTIIVLLILSGVSIQMLTGQNGLIERANKAKLESRAGTVKEEVDLWKSEKIMAEEKGNTVISMNELISEQLKGGLLTEQEAEQAKNTGKVKIGSQTIDYGEKAKTLVELYKNGELCLGDYVNYPNPTTGTYTVSAEKSGMTKAQESTLSYLKGISDQTFTISETENQLNWRVLGIDEKTGGLKLIAGSPMKRSNGTIPYFFVYGAESYIYGVDELDNISKLYKNDKYALEARSVTIDDINEKIGIKTDEDILKYEWGTTINFKPYGTEYTLNSAYTPETFLANNENKGTITGKVDGYYYYVNRTTGRTITVTDPKILDLFFKNIRSDTGNSYWLASKCCCFDGYNLNYGIGIARTVLTGDTNNWEIEISTNGSFFLSNGLQHGDGWGVRPVVILKPDITENQIHKIEDKEEEIWNYQKYQDS